MSVILDDNEKSFKIYKRILQGSFQLDELSVSSMIPYTIRKLAPDLIEIEFRANNFTNNYVSIKNHGSIEYSEILKSNKSSNITLFPLGSIKKDNIKIDSNMICNIWEREGNYVLLSKSLCDQNENYVSVSNRNGKIIDYTFNNKRELSTLKTQKLKDLEYIFDEWVKSEKINSKNKKLKKYKSENKIFLMKTSSDMISEFKNDNKFTRTYDVFILFKFLDILKICDFKSYEKFIKKLEKIYEIKFKKLNNWYIEKSTEDSTKIMNYLRTRLLNESEKTKQGILRECPTPSFVTKDFDLVVDNLDMGSEKLKNLGFFLQRAIFLISFPYMSFCLSLTKEEVEKFIRNLFDNKLLKMFYIDFLPDLSNNTDVLVISKPILLGFTMSRLFNWMNSVILENKKLISKNNEIKEKVVYLSSYVATIVKTIIGNYKNYNTERQEIENFKIHYTGATSISGNTEKISENLTSFVDVLDTLFISNGELKKVKEELQKKIQFYEKVREIACISNDDTSSTSYFEDNPSKETSKSKKTGKKKKGRMQFIRSLLPKKWIKSVLY